MALKLMGKKIGMTQRFDEKGDSVTCSVIAMEPNVVVQIKTQEKDGYVALQFGSHIVPRSRKKNISKPLVGHFASAKVEPRGHLCESRVQDVKEYEVGKEVGVEYFSQGEYVDVIGTSKGKGHQGVMKRYNHRGGPAAHGSGFHRHGGSCGMRTTPGRCLPGMKKSGHMGADKKTIECLKVVAVDVEKKVILVKGAIPGCKQGLVYIRKSVKKGAKRG